MTKPNDFRKKLLTTTQYIYQALYKEELNSDITVLALGKTWKLHKVYLCQSSYFASMFGGSWRETNQDFVNIEIIDPKINIDGTLMEWKRFKEEDHPLSENTNLNFSQFVAKSISCICNNLGLTLTLIIIWMS